MNIANDLTAYMCIHDGVDDRLLEGALGSIAAQTTLPCVFIYAFDGFVSEKKMSIVAASLARFVDLGVKCCEVRTLENEGHGVIRSLAISEVYTPYVATCDSDDLSAPGRFAALLSVIRSDSNLAGVGCHIYETNLLSKESAVYRKRVPLTAADVHNGIGTRCPLNQMTTILSLEALKSVGGYEDFYHNEDYYLWYKMLDAGFLLCNVDDYLVTAHSDCQSIGRRGGVKYFVSEAKIQLILYKGGYKSLLGLGSSIIVRFVVQVLFPSVLRRFFYSKFLREAVDE